MDDAGWGVIGVVLCMEEEAVSHIFSRAWLGGWLAILSAFEPRVADCFFEHFLQRCELVATCVQVDEELFPIFDSVFFVSA